MGSYATGPMGRSAPPSAILYQTTQASRQPQPSAPQPEAYEERTFQVKRGPMPEKPTPPKPPKVHGAWCQLIHRHRPEEDAREYQRKKAVYNKQYAEYLREKEAYENAVYTVPPPAARPRVEPETPEEEAMLKAKQEVPILAKEIEDTRNAIIQLQTRCENAKNMAKLVLRQKNQEHLAKTHIVDFMSARKSLQRATDAYTAGSMQLDCIVETMERFNHATDDKRRIEFQEVLGMSTFDAELEVKAVRDGMKSFNMPTSFHESARRENESEMQALIREFSAEAAQELHEALGTQPTPAAPASHEVLPPVEQPVRIPLAN